MPTCPRENETSDATQQSGQKESQQNLPVDPNADPCRAERIGSYGAKPPPEPGAETGHIQT